MELLIFILVAYGMSNIIVYGSILEGFRNFWKRVSPDFFGVLFSCMMCTPFWVGVLLSTTLQLMGYDNMSPLAGHGVDNMFLSIFLDACLTSGTVFVIHIIEEWFEAE